MVDIFHVCTYPADGNNYHKSNNQYISVFVNQVHHTIIEYRIQYLRMYFAALDLRSAICKTAISKSQISISQYANIKYQILAYSIQHSIAYTYTKHIGIGGEGF